LARNQSFGRPIPGDVNRQSAEDAKYAEPDAGLDDIARQVVRAAVEVHRVLGPGFLESVYEEALAVELGLRGLSFRRQVGFELEYKGARIGQARLDLLVSERLVVELKTSERLLPLHFAQVLSYLKATGQQLGLLINFNVPFLRQGIRRVILTP
jgi:GxxExxY protein